MSPTMSPTLSFSSLDDLTRPCTSKSGGTSTITAVATTNTAAATNSTPRNAKEVLMGMVETIEREELKQAIKVEIKRIFSNHDRLVTMLESRSEALEQENDDYKALAADHQRRYEKAVREMQFLRKEYEKARDMNKQYLNPQLSPQQIQQQQKHRPRSLSIESGSSGEGQDAIPLSHHHHHLLLQQQQQQQQQHYSNSQHKNNGPLLQSYPLTPTSPQPSVIPNDLSLFGNFDISSDYGSIKQKSTLPSRSSSTSTSNQVNMLPQWNLGTTQLLDKQSFISTISASSDGVPPPLPRLRQNSTTASLHSAHSSTTETSSFTSTSNNNITSTAIGSVASNGSNSSNGNGNGSKDKSSRKKQSWQLLQPNSTLPSPSVSGIASSSATFSAPPMNTSTSTKETSTPLASTSTGTAIHSVPMTPVRSSTATNGYTGASLIQQRRVDPLIFGGSDGLWDTISKSKGSDVTVEKIISNFLRRGGSPNTAKQSPATNAVKYGFGMIHALIVTKAPGSLDLLLQQGANPNAYTLGQLEDDKVTPCYLAASVGWLAGLQKLAQAGGDLMIARGGGAKNKTALHAAAEHCHAAVVEYIVEATQGRLNLEVDSLGATVLHYACASGHTDLVSFLARSCEIPVNQPDHRGELPLHWAARHGRLEVVTLLVERCGCDCNTYVPRRVGTPLDLARTGGHRRLVDYLKGLGALSAKKMEKRREEEMAKEVPVHLESTLLRNGFGLDDEEF